MLARKEKELEAQRWEDGAEEQTRQLEQKENEEDADVQQRMERQCQELEQQQQDLKQKQEEMEQSWIKEQKRRREEREERLRYQKLEAQRVSASMKQEADLAVVQAEIQVIASGDTTGLDLLDLGTIFQQGKGDQEVLAGNQETGPVKERPRVAQPGNLGCGKEFRQGQPVTNHPRSETRTQACVKDPEATTQEQTGYKQQELPRENVSGNQPSNIDGIENICRMMMEMQRSIQDIVQRQRQDREEIWEAMERRHEAASDGPTGCGRCTGASMARASHIEARSPEVNNAIEGEARSQGGSDLKLRKSKAFKQVMSAPGNVYDGKDCSKYLTWREALKREVRDLDLEATQWLDLLVKRTSGVAHEVVEQNQCIQLESTPEQVLPVTWKALDMRFHSTKLPSQRILKDLLQGPTISECSDNLFKFSQDCQLAMELHRSNPALLTYLDEQTNLEAITNCLDDQLMDKWLAHQEDGSGESAEESFEVFARWIRKQTERDLKKTRIRSATQDFLRDFTKPVNAGNKYQWKNNDQSRDGRIFQNSTWNPGNRAGNNQPQTHGNRYGRGFNRTYQGSYPRQCRIPEVPL
jgi:hypothetical protein